MKNNSIEYVRKELYQRENTSVELMVKSPRGKTQNINGTLQATYPNIFIVCIEENDTVRNMSFNYCDIISGKVMVLN